LTTRAANIGLQLAAEEHYSANERFNFINKSKVTGMTATQPQSFMRHHTNFE